MAVLVVATHRALGVRGAPQRAASAAAAASVAALRLERFVQFEPALFERLHLGADVRQATAELGEIGRRANAAGQRRFDL